jgi:hypothetical protein
VTVDQKWWPAALNIPFVFWNWEHGGAGSHRQKCDQTIVDWPKTTDILDSVAKEDVLIIKMLARHSNFSGDLPVLSIQQRRRNGLA